MYEFSCTKYKALKKEVAKVVKDKFKPTVFVNN